MNFLHYIFLLLLPLVFSHSYRRSNGYNRLVDTYLKPSERNAEETNGKFGSSRRNLFRMTPPFYEQKYFENPICLPHVWTCGPNLPPCCPGLMCYGGNAKRGRYCVAKG